MSARIRAERLCPWARPSPGGSRCGLNGSAEPGRITIAMQLPVRLAEITRDLARLYIVEAYGAADGQQRAAAKLLGISATALCHRILRDPELREVIAQRWPPKAPDS